MTEWFDAYIFDMDGTIYLGEELLPGAVDLIAELRRRNLPIRYLSNNPRRGPGEYAKKLERLGLPTPVGDIVNTVVTTVQWLRTNEPGAVVFPIAPPAVIEALVEADIRLSDDPALIDIVLASYDTGFDYAKLQIAFDALWRQRGARLMATNPDRYCPLPGGRGEPDTAAIVAAIEACTQVPLERHFGKPDPAMVAPLLAELGLEPGRVLMVGDRLSTDIALATNAGMASALVLTGDSTLEECLALPPSQRPTYVLEAIDQLIPNQS